MRIVDLISELAIMLMAMAIVMSNNISHREQIFLTVCIVVHILCDNIGEKLKAKSRGARAGGGES